MCVLTGSRGIHHAIPFIHRQVSAKSYRGCRIAANVDETMVFKIPEHWTAVALSQRLPNDFRKGGWKKSRSGQHSRRIGLAVRGRLIVLALVGNGFLSAHHLALTVFDWLSSSETI